MLSPLHRQALLAGQLGHTKEATKLLEKILKSNPQDFAALFHLGIIYFQTQKYQESIQYLTHALHQKPQHPAILNTLHIIYRDTCNWPALNQIETDLKSLTNQAAPFFTNPYHHLTSFDNPETNFQIATQWINKHTPPQPPLHQSPTTQTPLKLGFIGDCFRDFPTAHNLTSILELIDKSQFQIHLYTYGSKSSDRYTHRLTQAAYQVRDITTLNPFQAATQISQDHIHILLDLKGHIRNHRLQVLAYKPAPLIINYLAYPGTTGSPYHDYIISDPILIPPNQAKNYSEKLAYLPNCYRPTENQIKIDQTSTNYHLPQNSLIFSSFNSTYKITPRIAQIWSKLLLTTPGSVLWQLADNPQSTQNLLRCFTSQGVDPQRIIFAPKLPRAQHLKRLTHAHLALDTFPVNGHTTTTDNLLVGTPVITLSGQSLASRVSTSCLNAINLPELVTLSPKQYFHLTQYLASHPQKLALIKSKLNYSQTHYPLLNALLYSQNFQQTLLNLWQKSTNQLLGSHQPLDSNFAN